MTVTRRLLAAIWVASLLVVGSFAILQVRGEQQRLLEDLERRATLLGDALKEAIEAPARRRSVPGLTRVIKKFSRPDRRIIVFDNVGAVVVAVPDAPALPMPAVAETLSTGRSIRGLHTVDNRSAYIYVTLISADAAPLRALGIILDASHVATAEGALWRYNALRFLALASALSLITLIIVRATITRPLSDMAGWAKTLKAGQPLPPPRAIDAKAFGPLATEVAGLARSLYRAQAAAEEEAALRLAGEAIWTEERLKQFVRARFNGRLLCVVRNA